jgi:hypothetical protein
MIVRSDVDCPAPSPDVKSDFCQALRNRAAPVELGAHRTLFTHSERRKSMANWLTLSRIFFEPLGGRATVEQR